MTQLSAQDVLATLQGKGYTATQVVNSLTRSVAHYDRVKVSPVTKAVYKKALALAEKALQEAHANGFVPCGADCMSAHVEECVCHCGGKNHGMNLKALAA